jgi:hypothetical protein
MDEERTRRVGANEAVFRALNEELEGLNEAFAFASRTFLIVCECGDLTCVEQIEVSVEEYAQLRSDPTLFAVIQGHASPDTEEEIASRHGWDIVRKRKGLPAELARQTSS